MLHPNETDSRATNLARNVLLILLSVIVSPLSAIITVLAMAIQQLGALQPPRRDFTANERRTRVLVTGIGMSKGLFLARTMYLGGCDVFGADFKKFGNLPCGRFSNAIKRFFPLETPTTDNADPYISQVINIIKAERIGLWITCSKPTVAIEDARLADIIKEETNCKVFQFDEQVISILNDKLSFMRKTSERNLANVEWYPLYGNESISNVIEKISKTSSDGRPTKFMIKSACHDDVIRGTLPLLRSDDLAAAERHLRSLDYSQGRQWILQEFIESSEEYCTHAVVVNGRIRAFTACPSEAVNLHYRRMDSSSILYQKMLQFTKDYATGLGDITGHLSFDFLVRYQPTEAGFAGSLVPIECNPRCHTATVLFHGLEHQLSNIYLESISNGETDMTLLEPTVDSESGSYWLAHDLVTLVLLPLCNFVYPSARTKRMHSLQHLIDFTNHLVVWKDPTFLWWDPLPWFALNHLFWPGQLILAIWNGTRWKQLNVSTMNVFEFRMAC